MGVTILEGRGAITILGGIRKYGEDRSIPISYISNRILTRGDRVSNYNDNINYTLCKSFEL